MDNHERAMRTYEHYITRIGALRPLLSCCMLLIPLALRAQPKWHVATASVTFEIKNAGLPVQGSFEGLEADLRFDPAQPTRSRIIASVDAATVTSGIRLRDKHLRGRDYFDVAHYPRIHLECVRIEKAEGKALRGRFRLQIKDVAQEVTMPLTFTRAEHGGRLAGHFRINRLDFGLGEKSLILADTVTVRLAVHLDDPE
jgi:polyisoprenoid-binding protein YceI